MNCKVCGKKIETVDTGNDLLVEQGVCLQCGVDLSMTVKCEVCGTTTKLTDAGKFMGHAVCNKCRIEDLLTKVDVTCEMCGKTVKLLNACEYKGKHACRDCGLALMRERSATPQKKTGKITKWPGL
ncbi:MAG: hypothetical protein ABIF71_01410 [Planctomycetota bacterium]